MLNIWLAGLPGASVAAGAGLSIGNENDEAPGVLAAYGATIFAGRTYSTERQPNETAIRRMLAGIPWRLRVRPLLPEGIPLIRGLPPRLGRFRSSEMLNFH